jgi:hypothetical protein
MQWLQFCSSSFSLVVGSSSLGGVAHHSDSSMLETLGEGDEFRAGGEYVVFCAVDEMLIWPSASTSSRGMRSIWRPTRLGM